MKKVTLLFLLLFSLISYNSTAQSYKYHRFYSVVNGTPITQQFAEANCGNTYSFQQLRGRNYVNIQIDTPLSSRKFYLLNFGNGLKYYYLYTSSTSQHNDEDYTLSLPYNITSICTPIDSDGDGIPDYQDNCIDEKGPQSNNGCPAASINIIDFKVNEAANKSFPSGTRFDFEFKIKGNYTYKAHGHRQINLFVYKGNNTSSSNEIARSYWNREGDYNLKFTSYTKQDWWNTSLINYSTNPGQIFTLKVQYAGLTKIYTYTYPIIKPMFSVTKAIISHNKQHWDVLNGEKPTLNTKLTTKGTPSTTLDLVLKANNGSPILNRGVRDIYLSNKSVLGSGNNIWSKHLSKAYINYVPNEERNAGITMTLPSRIDFGGGVSNFMVHGKTHYLHVIFNPQTNFTVKKLVIPFMVNSLDQSTSLTIRKIITTYPIEIYNLQGQKILSKEVYNIEEENKASLELPTGIYIIKSKNGDRKVYVD